MKGLFTRAAFAGAVVLSLIVAACGGADPTATPPPTATAPQRATPSPAPAATATSTPRPQPTATPQPAPTATPAPAVPSGEMRVAMQEMNFDLLPFSAAERRYQDPLYDSVVGTTATGEVDAAAGIARVFESSADLKTWTFRLRNDVVFSNGDKLTAEDLKWTIDFHRRAESTVTGAARLRDNILAMDTPDPQTLILRLKDSHFLFAVEFFSALGTSPVNYVLPKNYMQAAGREGFNKAPIGSGPYKLKAVTVGTGIDYESADKHWYYGAPANRSLKFLRISEEATRVALLRGGRAEVVEVNRTRGGELRKAGFNVFEKQAAATAIVWLNELWKKDYKGVPNPLAEVRVREALSIAIDRQTIVDTFLHGLGKPTISYPVYSWDPAYNEIPVPKYNPVRARQLLKDAGYPNGFELDLWMSTGVGLPEALEIMEAIAVWFENVGIKVLRISKDYQTYIGVQFVQKFEKPTAGGILFSGNRLISSGMNAYVSSSASRVVEDPEFDALAKQWRAALDIKEYIRIGQIVQQKVNEQWLTLTLFEAGDNYAAIPRLGTAWNLGKGPYGLRINSIATGKA